VRPVPHVDDRSRERRAGVGGGAGDVEGECQQGARPDRTVRWIASDIRPQELLVYIVGALSQLRSHHAGGRGIPRIATGGAGVRAAEEQERAGGAEKDQSLPAAEHAANGDVVDVHGFSGYGLWAMGRSSLVRAIIAWCWGRVV
jgi:hypothetical protein